MVKKSHRLTEQETAEKSPETAAWGYIFDIQRFSVNDGPGIRTTVFFKGCPLKCLWCDNPESQSALPQMLYLESLCNRCGRCVEVCPSGATKAAPDGSIQVDHSLCQISEHCVEVCPSEARILSGKLMSVTGVLEIVRKDELFYRNSGGGVTASGGEPTQQPEFLTQLFRECRRYGIHTTLDTTGYIAWPVLEGVLEFVDLVYYDLKHMDAIKHRELTGVDNQLILANALLISQRSIPMVVRLPMIPGYNDSADNIKQTVEFVSGLQIERVDIVPFHQLGSMKYDRLGMTYQLGDLKPYTEEEVEKLKETFVSYGLEVTAA